MSGNNNLNSNKTKKSLSRPYDRDKSILGRMKGAMKKYTPSWVQTFINDDEDDQREKYEGRESAGGFDSEKVGSYRRDVETYESGVGSYKSGVRRETEDRGGIEGAYTDEGLKISEHDNSVTVEFNGYEATFPRKSVHKEDDVVTECESYKASSKLKRGREWTDNYKEDTSTEVRSRPSIKRFALSRGIQNHDTDDNSSIGKDRPINSFLTSHSSPNIPLRNHIASTPSKHTTNSASTPLSRSSKFTLRATKSSVCPANRSSIQPNTVIVTTNQPQRPTTRLFMSNRGRSFVSRPDSPSPHPTTPLYTKKDRNQCHTPSASPFYNRPITYGGIMAYQGLVTPKPHKSDHSSSAQPPKSGSHLNSTMQRISQTLNRFENEDGINHKDTSSSYQFPPLKYDTQIYKRMTAGGTSSKLGGPPVKNRQTPILPKYSINQQPSKNLGKMRRERDKLHEVRGDDVEDDNDDVAKESELFLSNIRLPPVQMKPFTSPPSSSSPKPSSSSLPASSSLQKPSSSSLSRPPLSKSKKPTHPQPSSSHSKSSSHPSSHKNNNTKKKRFHFRKPISIKDNSFKSNLNPSQKSFPFNKPIKQNQTRNDDLSKQSSSKPSSSSQPSSSSKPPSSQPPSSSQPSLLGSFTVNYGTAKRKEVPASKSPGAGQVTQLKQGSVLDALNKPLATVVPSTAPVTTQAPLSALFATTTASKWICPTCMVENASHMTSCPCCLTTKPITKTPSQSLFSTKAPTVTTSPPSPSILIPTSICNTQKSLTELFKTSAELPGWKCPTCMVSNKHDQNSCPCCNEPKPAAATTAAATVVVSSIASSSTANAQSGLPSLSSMFAAKQGEWSCEVCMLRNSPGANKCAACESHKPASKSVSFGSAPTTTSSTPMSTTPAASTSPFSTTTFGATLTTTTTSTPFAATTTPATASQVQLNVGGGGFKFPMMNSTASTGAFDTASFGNQNDSGTVNQDSTTTTTTASSAFTGGFKPSSSSLLSSNLPTSQIPTTASNNFGGFKFGANHSLPTTAATTFVATTTTAGNVVSEAAAKNSLFAFGMTPSSSSMFAATTTTTTTGFGNTTMQNGSTTNAGFFAAFKPTNTTTASFQPPPSQPMFGGGLTNTSQSAFVLAPASTASFFAPTTTTNSMFGSNATATTKPISSMFASNTNTTTTINSMFANNAATSNPLFNNNIPTTSSHFPPSNIQFSLFPNSTTTTANTFVTPTTTQNSFLPSNTSTTSNSFQLPNNNINTFSGFTKQENNSNNNNFHFNNNKTNFSTPSALNHFKFGASQTTTSASSGMFGATPTTTAATTNATGSGMFQFGAQAPANPLFPSPQAFSFSMGKQTENPKKRAFNSSADNEVDSKKSNSTMLPSGSSFRSTSSSILPPQASTTFTFGQQPTQQQPTQQQQTTQQPQPSNFSFGQQQNNAFTFGQPQQTQQQPTPFQFGNQQQPQQEKSVFSFGQTQQQQPPNPQQSTFTFGQQAQQQPPAFGQQTPQQQPQQNQQQPAPFTFSSTPNFNFTGSGNTSNATFSAPSSTPIPGRSYKKAIRRMRK